MKMYKCDRCGEEIDPIDCYFVSMKNTAYVSNIELCPDCLDSFKRWLKGKEEEGKQE